MPELLVQNALWNAKNQLNSFINFRQDFKAFKLCGFFQGQTNKDAYSVGLTREY